MLIVMPEYIPVSHPLCLIHPSLFTSHCSFVDWLIVLAILPPFAMLPSFVTLLPFMTLQPFVMLAFCLLQCYSPLVQKAM